MYAPQHKHTKHPWTMALKEKGLVYCYWNLQVREFFNLPVSLLQLQSLKNYLNLHNRRTETSQALEQKQVAKRDYKRVARLVKDIRQKELKMKANEHGLASQTNWKIILKMILGGEQMKLECKYLYSFLSPMKCQSITSIAISQIDRTTKSTNHLHRNLRGNNQPEY